MGRLIDADALIKFMQDSKYKNGEPIYNPVLHELINFMPTVDLKPVRHGRWIKDESTYAGPGLDNLQCSECKRNAVTWRRDIPLSRMYRYCPNCGAKMDLEVADDIQGL